MTRANDKKFSAAHTHQQGEIHLKCEDQGQPWLKTLWDGGVQDPKGREEGKNQDQTWALQADFGLFENLLGRVP